MPTCLPTSMRPSVCLQSTHVFSHSPELILDRKRDYILYVVDPQETYKASVRRARQQFQSRQGGIAVASSSFPSTSSSSFRSHGGSDSNSTNAIRDSVFIGRGFFGWILEEQGDGDTVVVGKVSSGDGRGHTRMDCWERNSYKDDDSDDDIYEEEYLDVEIRMKETQSQSREQYFSMLRQFGSGPRSATQGKDPLTAVSHQQAKRKASKPPSIGASGPFSSTGTGSRSSSAPRPRPITSMSPPSRPIPALTPPAIQPYQQIQTLQVLQVLQALQAQQQQQQQAGHPIAAPVAAPLLSASAMEALFGITGFAPSSQLQAVAPTSLTTQSLTAGLVRSVSAPKVWSPNDEPPPQREGGAAQRALVDVFKAAGLPLPSHMSNIFDYATANALAEMKVQTPVSSSSTLQARGEDASSSHDPALTTMQCYNCGVKGDSKLTWRLVVPMSGQKIGYPGSFECDPSKDDEHQDPQDLVIDEDGFATANGRSSWRACNRCGLFWAKWKKNRPEKLEKQRKVASAGPPTAASGARKRARIDGNASGTPLEEDDQDEDEERDEIEDSSPTHQPLPADPAPKPQKRLRRSNPMELVRDKYGQWRSKRSVQENPEGRRPGRPPGCKTGEGQGKSRYARRRALQSSQTPEVTGLTVQTSMNPASKSSSKDRKDADDHVANLSLRPPLPYAQSSPLPGRAAVSGRQFPWATVGRTHQDNGPPNPAKALNLTPDNLTPNRRAVRYGAPSHLLTSSPTTALDALLSDGDFRFDFASHGTAIGANASGVMQSSPVRRSPRKQPSGTREHCNPYASIMSDQSSASGKDASLADSAALFDMDFFAAFTNFHSPNSDATGSKKPSPASQASQDEDISTAAGTDSIMWAESRQHGATLSSSMMTTMTSPGSPSPTSWKQFEGHGPAGRPLTSRKRKILMGSSSPAVQGLMSIGENDSEGEEEVGESPSRARKQRLNSQRSASACLASPSLGQKRKRDDAVTGKTSAAKAATATTVTFAEMTLTKGPATSPATSRRGSSCNATPLNSSDLAAPAAGCLLIKSTSKSPALCQSPRIQAKDSAQTLTVISTRRKPLPATVEDAPSSSVGSSPADDGGISPYDHGTVESLFDMLEDPYGLLGANGIGLAGVSTVGADESSGTFSMERFDAVQLHDRLQFGSHYRAFTEDGGKGVAALAFPTLAQQVQDTDAKIVESSPARRSIAGTPSAEQAHQEAAKPATPIQKTVDPLASKTPRSTSRQAHFISSRAIRSSPRFASKLQEYNDSLAMPPPPKTPQRKVSAGPNSAADVASANAACRAHSTESPRTPRTKSKLSPTSLALANAVVRSPALQRILASTAGTAGNLVANGKMQSPEPLDFSTLFATAGSLGSLSPLFSTPGGLLKEVPTPAMTTPLSPGLCRLLNSFAQEQDPLAFGAPQQQTMGNGNEKVLAPVGPVSTDPGSFPAEAFAELSQFLQEANFESLMGSGGVEAGGGGGMPSTGSASQ